jgi:hypothetical protein
MVSSGSPVQRLMAMTAHAARRIRKAHVQARGNVLPSDAISASRRNIRIRA